MYTPDPDFPAKPHHFMSKRLGISISLVLFVLVLLLSYALCSLQVDRSTQAILADKNRFALLPEIVRQFRLLELRDRGEGLCVFRCAREPDDESLRSLAKLLCARHGCRAVTFEIVQDDTLLGGFTAEIDGVTYDKSVRGQLRALAHDL